MQQITRTNAFVAGLAGVSLLAFSALTAKAQTMPAAPPVPKAAVTSSLTAGDMLADKIQGLTVYTVNPEAKPENRVAAPGNETMVKTVTKDEYARMTKGYTKVGAIDDIVVTADGKIKDAVLSVGGFLGVGDKDVALSWSDLTFVKSVEGDTFAYIGKSKGELEKLPEFHSPK